MLRVYTMGETRWVGAQGPYRNPCFPLFQSLNHPAVHHAVGDEFRSLLQHCGEQAVSTVIDQRHLIEVDHGAAAAKLRAKILPNSAQLRDPWANQLSVQYDPLPGCGLDDGDL